ncbi:hypothetical protein EJD97_010398, partial [Solanum chilense]
MTNEGDLIGASTTLNVRTDGGKKSKKGKKQQKGNGLILPQATPSEGQTSHPPTIVDGSDEDTGEDVVDVTIRHEWIARVETARQAVEIIGQRLNETDRSFKALEDYSLEEITSIRKELEARQRAEFETKERSRKIERLLDPHHMTGKGSLESKLPSHQSSKAFVRELAILWWKRKESDIAKGTCTMNTWEQFRVEFKKAFFPNNVIYEAKCKFRELRQKGSIRAYVREFTTLTLRIPNLTDEDMLFNFMDGLQNWARTELERRQVRTIDEAITQAEALTDFRQEKSLSVEEDEDVGSHDDSEEDSGEGEEQRPQPKRRGEEQRPHKHDTYKSNGKKSGDRVNTVRNQDGCYICSGPHSYKKCPQLKSLCATLRERKEEKSQEEDEVGETKQLGLINLCGAIINEPSKTPRRDMPRQAEPKHADKGLAKSMACAQYVDITINGQCARVLVDTGAEVNIMTKTAATRLGLRYTPSNAQIRTVNAPPIPVAGIAHRVNITIGDWRGKTKFVVAPLNLYDIILGQKFFQQYHAVIDPYLQQLKIMEKGGTFTVPMRLTSTATIASSREDNGAEKSLPPQAKRVPRRNTAVMKKPPRHLPPTKEEVRKIGSRK